MRSDGCPPGGTADVCTPQSLTTDPSVCLLFRVHIVCIAQRAEDHVYRALPRPHSPPQVCSRRGARARMRARGCRARCCFSRRWNTPLFKK
eukprot:gene8585-biopygen7633